MCECKQAQVLVLSFVLHASEVLVTARMRIALATAEVVTVRPTVSTASIESAPDLYGYPTLHHVCAVQHSSVWAVSKGTEPFLLP